MKKSWKSQIVALHANCVSPFYGGYTIEAFEREVQEGKVEALKGYIHRYRIQYQWLYQVLKLAKSYEKAGGKVSILSGSDNIMIEGDTLYIYLGNLSRLPGNTWDNVNKYMLRYSRLLRDWEVRAKKHPRNFYTT